MKYKGFLLDPFQEKAINAIENNNSVIVSAPTGAGKTLIAEYAIDKALQTDKRLIYTSPIKALSNQKYSNFSKEYENKIGIVTGDININPNAQVLIMTTEIFRNTIFDDPERLQDVSFVIFDEVHYMDDEERGTVWEESIIFAPKHIKFVCLSATVSNIKNFANWIRKIRSQPIRVVNTSNRPVPLKHLVFLPKTGIITPKQLQKYEIQFSKIYRNKRNHNPRSLRPDRKSTRNLIVELKDSKRLPALCFLFNRIECEKYAKFCQDLDLLSNEEKTKSKLILNKLINQYGIEMMESTTKIKPLLLNGIAYHHAGLLPAHKEIVEKLFEAGLLKLIFATETFALGINMPAKSVIFGQLSKFNGKFNQLLKTRDYMQMSGRAGRRGIDDVGYVFSMLEFPRFGYDEVNTLLSDNAEPIKSQFNLSYSSILNLHIQLKGNIIQAASKSFSNFTNFQNKNRRRTKKNKHKFYSLMIEQMKRKIALLKKLKYINPNNSLSEKGEMMKNIYGYEIQFSELYNAGLFYEATPLQIAIIINAIIFEPRRKIWYKKLSRSVIRKNYSKILYTINKFIVLEKSFGIKIPIKELDFSMATVVSAWINGASFEELANYTDATPGDIVRNFRLMIQLMRQISHLKEIDKFFKNNIIEAISLINKDIIDAEMQLRRGL